MDVGDWLRSLGLGQHEALFRENEIDTEVLPELTDGDLEKIGVPLGHRKRLLKAVATLSAAEAVAKPTSSGPTQPFTDAAERRQLTVMFCDLVGSTALSAQLDPEDLRGVINAYHRCCAELIERNGGFVAKYMGDGVLAYFGYPQAHEHDAERAVRAGLAIVEAAPKLVTAASSSLHVRVGIATGVAVVLRTQGDPTAVMGSVRRAVEEIDPGEVVYNVETMDEVVSNSFAARRLSMMLLSIFAALALVLVVVAVAAAGYRAGGYLAALSAAAARFGTPLYVTDMVDVAAAASGMERWSRTTFNASGNVRNRPSSAWVRPQVRTHAFSPRGRWIR